MPAEDDNKPLQADEVLKRFGPGALRQSVFGADAGGVSTASPPEVLAAFEKLVGELADLDRSEKLARWSAFIKVEGRLDALAVALGSHQEQVEAALVQATSLTGMKDHVDRLRSTLRAKLRATFRVAEPDEEAPSMAAALRTNDIPKLVVPQGWTVNTGGVFRQREREGMIDTFRVTYSPLAITKSLTDIETHEEQLELAWTRRGVWRRHVVPRLIASDARMLHAETANEGSPVNSSNNRSCVEFLAALEAANLNTMPHGYSSTTMGWVGRQAKYFLAGQTVLHAGPAAEHDVQFVGQEGTQQLAEAVRSSGTWEDWLELLHQVQVAPVAYAAIYVALAAPLLKVTGCPNFIVDWSGRSGRGKTTTARLGASVWGLPEDSSGYLRSWAASLTGVERTAAALNFMPIILDESNKVPERDRPDIARVLYMLANGSGRVRGTVRGMQRVASWRTVAISTGESSIVQYSRDEGTRARTISITGQPLGNGPGAAKLAETLRSGLSEHFGHAGPRLVRWLIAHREEWPKLKDRYRRRVEHWGSRASSDMARRASEYMALIELAAELLHQELGVPWPSSSPLDVVWDAIEEGAQEGDQGAAALELAYEWASSHQQSFWGRHEERRMGGGPVQPPRGWLGAWKSGEMWDGIAFIPNQLDRMLRDNGFEPDAIYGNWKDRGWLRTRASGKGRTYPSTIQNSRPCCVVVKRTAVDELHAETR